MRDEAQLKPYKIKTKYQGKYQQDKPVDSPPENGVCAFYRIGR
jgi:hypothetical protein